MASVCSLNKRYDIALTHISRLVFHVNIDMHNYARHMSYPDIGMTDVLGWKKIFFKRNLSDHAGDQPKVVIKRNSKYLGATHQHY